MSDKPYERVPSEKPTYRTKVKYSDAAQSYYAYYPSAAKNQVWNEFKHEYDFWEVIIRGNNGVVTIYDIYDKYKTRLKQEKIDSIPVLGGVTYTFRKDTRRPERYFYLMEFMSAMNINTMSLKEYKKYGENLQQIFEERLMDAHLKRKFLTPGEESLPHACKEAKKYKNPKTIEEL